MDRTEIINNSPNNEKCGICQQNVNETGVKGNTCKSNSGHWFHPACYDTISERHIYGCMLCTSLGGDTFGVNCKRCGKQARSLGESYKKDIIKARLCHHTHLRKCQQEHRNLFNFPEPTLDNYDAHSNNAHPPCHTCMLEGMREKNAGNEEIMDI